MNGMKCLVAAIAVALAFSGQALAAADFGPERLDILKLPEWPVTASSYGGRLLLSASS